MRLPHAAVVLSSTAVPKCALFGYPGRILRIPPLEEQNWSPANFSADSLARDTMSPSFRLAFLVARVFPFPDDTGWYGWEGDIQSMQWRGATSAGTSRPQPTLLSKK